MTYIRTKDEIYKSKRKLIEQDCLVIGEKENGEIGLVRKDIIKQSDFIEELCDSFVCWTTRDESVFMDMVQVKFNSKYFKYKSIYGAIWTEWGLKYVAKMNDKGVFELL